ncbi:flagellar biosynthetic protein FliO [bacterium]|nr:flagellar biosynthetic protein FliO [bacterium]
MKNKLIWIFIATCLMSFPVHAEEGVKNNEIKTDSQSLLELLEKNSAKNEDKVPDDKQVQATAEPAKEEVKTAEEAAVPVVSVTQNTNPLIEEAQDGQLPWLKTGLSFAFVASTILILAFLYQKKGGSSPFNLSKSNSLKIIQNVSLGLKRSLHVVEFDGQRLLLASTATDIRVLSGKAEALQMAIQNLETTVSEPSQFVAQKVDGNSNSLKKEQPVLETAKEELTMQRPRIRDKMVNLKPLHNKGAISFKEDLFEKNLKKFSGDETFTQDAAEIARGHNLNTLM